MLKRAIDVTVAAIVLAVMAPILAVLALAIVIESPGPVFYRAQRVGYRGRPLRMLKLRKMRPDARGPALTAADDERLTRVGALLARTRLDEIPQFWHVLRGEMSLIGPRPEDPRFVQHRRVDYDEILTVRPGISGFAQLAFADERRLLSGEDPIGEYLTRVLPQKCALDLLYVRNATVLTDVRIALWTLCAVVLRRPVAVDRRTGRLSLRSRPAAGEAPPPEPSCVEPRVSVAHEKPAA